MPDRKTIMVIEDDDDLLTAIVDLLEGRGFEVMQHDRASGAIDKLMDRKPDLVVLDITTPEQAGLLVYRELRSFYDTREIPVVVLANPDHSNFDGYVSSDRSLALPEGMVQKPVEVPPFLTAIEEALLKAEAAAAEKSAAPEAEAPDEGGFTFSA